MPSETVAVRAGSTGAPAGVVPTETWAEDWRCSYHDGRPLALRRLALLDTMAVSQDHFTSAMGSCNPSSLRETVVEVPNIKWDDIGGLEETKRQLQDGVSCSMARLVAARPCLPRQLQASALPISSASRDQSC